MSIETWVWATIAACMSVSLLIGFWAGRRFTSFWPKLVFVLVASVLGIFIYPFVGGLLAGGHPEQERLINAVFRKDVWTAIGGIVAMAAFGAWRLPAIIKKRNSFASRN